MHTQRSHRLLAMAASFLTPLVSPVIAHAAAAAADATQTVGEVVVTAQKRAGTLQTTPISITAVTGDQLERQGVTGVDQLATATPGVSVQSVGPGRSNYDIRGLSNAGGSSATVGFYLDEVPVTPPTSALAASGKSEIDPSLYDLSRVEVLRGPQGTLYGASSMGGTIRLITNQPKLDRFEASGETIGSETEHGGANGAQNFMVNLPLIDDKLALRISGTEKYDSGFINRVVVNNFPAYTGSLSQFRGDLLSAPVTKTYKDVNDDLTQAIRTVLLWKPTDRLSVTASVFAQHLKQGGQQSYDAPPGTLNHYQPSDVAESFEQDFQLYSLTAKYDFDKFTVQSTSSEMRGHMRNEEDDQEQLDSAFGLPFTVSPGDSIEYHNQSQFTEELRASSSGSGKLQWIVGAFYSDFKDTLVYNLTYPAFTAPIGTSNVFNDWEPDGLEQEALFGEVTYAILPNLKANFGLRYYDYRFTFTQNISGIVTAPPYDFTGGSSASGVNPKFNLSWEVNHDLTLYATAAKGFRPGGPNLPVPPNAGSPTCTSVLNGIGLSSAPAAFSPDTVWSYEVGEKARLDGGQFGIRSSLYYIDWSDIQQQIQLACGFNFTANAGTAESKGAEVEFDAKLLPELTWHENLGYTDATLTSVQSVYASAIATGQQLQDVPKFTASTAFDFVHPLGGSTTLTAHLEDRYVSKVNDLSAQPYPATTRPSYNIVDARLGLEKEKISYYFYVDNLFNKRAQLGFDHSEALNTSGYARIIPNRPRTIGIDIQYHY